MLNLASYLMWKESLIVGNNVHLDPRTGQFWKGITQGLLKQTLVPIGPVVSKMKILKISSPFFISSNSGHVGWRSGLSDTILEGDHPRTIPPKFDLNWSSGFRGEDFLVIVDGWTTNAK
jgi:hypothetical protein